MTKDFIPYEQAKELKELGFDEDCMGTYSTGGQVLPLKPYTTESKAILFSQAFRWFRKKHKLSGTPQYFTGGFYCYTINDMKDTEKSNRLFTEFETYEEAELACLKKLIELVKK